MLAARASALFAVKRGAETFEPLQTYLADYREGVDVAQCRARLCVALVQCGKVEEARAAWKEFSARHAGDRLLLPTTLYLADEAAKAGEPAIAREWLEFAADPAQPAEVRGRALQQLAALAQQQKSPEAARSFQTLLKSQPKDKVAAVAALAQARQWEQEEQTDAALAGYLQWLKDYPEAEQRPDALLAAARLHHQAHQCREAVGLLEKLLDQHPQYAQLDTALYQLAGALVDLDRSEEASQHYAALHKKHPSSRFWEDATYRLADHYLRAKRAEEASGLLRELVEKGQDDDLIARALLLQDRAAAAEQRWTT